MFVKVLEAPTEDDWAKVKQRALVTVGAEAKTPPTKESGNTPFLKQGTHPYADSGSHST